MATQNLTRNDGFNKTRGVCVATAIVDYTDNIATSADIYELFVLPSKAYITKAEIFVLTASDAATSAVADVGFAGGDTLIDGVNLKSAADSQLNGGTNSVIPQYKDTGGTITIKPTYTGATTAGKFRVVIEYVETDATTGALTNYSATA